MDDPGVINYIILWARNTRVERVRRIIDVNRLPVRIGKCDKAQFIFICRTLYYRGLVRGNDDKFCVFCLDCLITLLQLNELDDAERSPRPSIE